MMQTLEHIPTAGQPKAPIYPWTRWRPAWVLGLASMIVGGVLPPALAQFPPCPPPAANEYLLLVRSNTEAERTRVQDLLPSNSTVMVCDYLEDTVVRAGGFTNLENANAWAQYMTEVEGFQAFVARPAANSEPTTPTTTTPETNPSAPDNATATNSQPTTPTTTTPETNPSASDSATATNSQPGAEATPTEFTPQPLGEGFAVLVDYQYDPEMAVSIQDQIGQAVGLAVHKQRPYLLIAYSPNIDGAASTMDVLGGLRDFWIYCGQPRGGHADASDCPGKLG